VELFLKNKSVLIAGATGVLGRAISMAFASEGARLALGGRDIGALKNLQKQALELGAAAAEILEWDLSSQDSTTAAITGALHTFTTVDVFVAAAGAAQGGVFWDIDDEAWQRNLEAKLFGTLRALRAVGPAMIRQGTGRIVLVIGNSARQPEPRMLPGAVANAGLLAVVRGLAEEFGPHGVSINAVNPGPVRSSRWQGLMEQTATREGITPLEAETRFLERAALRRLATPDEIANHVMFLSSEAAAHMTGTSITIDGGSTKTP